MIGGEGSATDRMINQIMNSQSSHSQIQTNSNLLDKQEMNKENIVEENNRNLSNIEGHGNTISTKSLMMIS